MIDFYFGKSFASKLFRAASIAAPQVPLFLLLGHPV